MIYDKRTVLAAAEIARNYDEAHAQVGRAIAKKIEEELLTGMEFTAVVGKRLRTKFLYNSLSPWVKKFFKEPK